MNYLREVLAICGTAGVIAYWACTRSDGTALTALFAFLGGLAIATANSKAETAVSAS
jgi:hypothetical protein